MTAEFLDGYEATVAEILASAQDIAIKGLILCGGGRHFSVGADVAALATRSAEELSQMQGEITIPSTHQHQKRMVTAWRTMPFPVVSAVSGFCIGSGSEIALSAHYRICEKNARIGQPESTFGILPALGGIAHVIACCGVQNAVKLVYSGDLIPAQEAYAMHWADILTEKKKSLAEATALIQWIARQDSPFDPNRTEWYLEGYLREKGDGNA
jgi:enoyl-CoA hydratase